MLVFEQKPKYLLIDELDKLSRRDQAILLNLMKSGIVFETEYNKARKIELRTSVFKTSSNVEKIIPLLHSRFFIATLQGHTYEQLYEITAQRVTYAFSQLIVLYIKPS